MKKYKIGYTQGVYDLFHIGHLNLLNNAKKYCDFLIVGVNSDDLVMKYKNKKPIINENERAKIVENIKPVDKVFVVSTLHKTEIVKKYKIDVVFIGSDWKGNERWNATESELKSIGCDVVYLEHTDGISSSIIRKNINEQHLQDSRIEPDEK